MQKCRLFLVLYSDDYTCKFWTSYSFGFFEKASFKSKCIYIFQGVLWANTPVLPVVLLSRQLYIKATWDYSVVSPECLFPPELFFFQQVIFVIAFLQLLNGEDLEVDHRYVPGSIMAYNHSTFPESQPLIRAQGWSIWNTPLFVIGCLLTAFLKDRGLD